MKHKITVSFELDPDDYHGWGYDALLDRPLPEDEIAAELVKAFLEGEPWCLPKGLYTIVVCGRVQRDLVTG